MKILRPERVEAKGAHNDGRETGDRRIGDLSADGHDKQDPRLRIVEGLPRLLLLEMMVLDALAIAGHPLDSNDAFSLVQKLGGGREIGQDQQRHHAPRDTAAAEDEEDVHPLRQPRRDVAHRIPDQPTEHGRHAVGAIVGLQPQRLLGRRVPHAHQEHEARVDGGLHGAQEEAVGADAGEVVAGRRRDEDDAPAQRGAAEHLGDGQPLHQVARRVLGEEVAEVEDGAQPGVVLAVHARARLQPVHAGIVDAVLVEVLQQVRDEEDGHDAEVDLAQHPLGFLVVDVVARVAFVEIVVVVEV